MIRLFIEDNELDVNQGFSNQITYAIDDLQNLDSKATAFSKTIVLPGTANNNRLLGNIFEFGSANFTVDGTANVEYNFNASRSAKMKMEYNGVQVIKGTLRLLEIIIDDGLIEYEIALFGELGGFFAKLGNKKINELDFSSYNHIYSVTNIINSWNNHNAGYGYYYPLIDYGNVSVNKIDYDYKAFRPSLFVKEIFDKIITENGFTWESNFFKTNFAKSLIIPNNQDRLTTVKTQALQANFLVTPLEVNTTASLRFQNVIGGFDLINENKLKYISSNASLNYNINYQGYIYIQNTGLLSARLSGNLYTYINGVQVTGSGKNININKPVSNVPYFIPFSYNFSGQYNFLTNDTIEIKFIPSGINTFTQAGFSPQSGNLITATSPVPIVLPVTLNDNLILNSTLPINIKQKDFFASILKMFYLMVTEDKFKERHLIIEPWVDFYQNDRTTYLDWSDKVDRSQVIKIKPMSELNARYYQICYKSDNDWRNEEYRKLYQEGYGDRIYDNGFEFAKETDKTEVIFSATPLVGYVVNNVAVDKIVSAIYKRNNTLEERMASNIRILYANKLTGYSNWYIQNNGTNLSSALTDYGYAGHLNDPDVPSIDINFGATKQLYFTLVAGALSNNLFNAYYSSYLAEITDKDSRLLTVKMKFTESDIYNLDFSRYVLIDGVLYRLQKIIDYTPGELCEVQLLRVISTNYN
jgi:hypothetical protein